VVRLAPKERAARVLLAQVYASQKQAENAYTQWAALAEADARDLEAHLQAAGLAADFLKRPRDAEKWLRRAQKGSPRDPRPALLLGRFLLAKRDPKGAAQVLGQIAKTRPDVFEIYPLLADARAAIGDSRGAREALGSAILRLPKGTTSAQRAQIARAEGGLRLSLGRLWGQAKKPREARTEFARAATLLPRETEAHSMLALASLQSGDRSGAVKALQSALAIDPKRLRDRRFLAQLLAQNRNWKPASAQYALYTQAQPRDVGAWEEWAQVAARAGETEQELRILAKLTELQPRNARLHLQRGALLRDRKRPAEALMSFERALALQKDDPNALAEIARLQTQLKQPKQAAASWKKLIVLRPDYTPAYRAMLESSARGGEGAAARAFLSRQLSKTRENPRVLSEVLRFYTRTKQDSQAQALLKEIVMRNPKNRFARAALDSYAPISVAPRPPKTDTPAPTAAPDQPAPASTPSPVPEAETPVESIP
jgi:tetratricopeptide (TPR) repeat protein